MARELSGRFVIQCKFTSKRDQNLRQSDLTDGGLSKKGRCHCYILMTNAGLAGSVAEDIGEVFRDAGVQHVLVF